MFQQSCINPSWNEYSQYRIAPKKEVIRYRRFIRSSDRCFIIDVAQATADAPEHVVKWADFIRWIDEDWIEEIV